MKYKVLSLIGLVFVGLGAAFFIVRAAADSPSSLRLHGIVEIQEVRLSSKVGGRIKQVMVQEGNVVSAGQPLVVLDLCDWQAKRAQTAAQLDIAKAQLDKARNGAREEERAVARAALAIATARMSRLKNGTRPEEVEASLKDWESLKADEERARKDWQREQTLSTQHATSPKQVDAAWAAVVRLNFQAKAAQQRWKMLVDGPRIEEINEAEADVARLLAQCELLERGTRYEDIAEAEARVNEITAKLQEMDVHLREGVVVAPNAARVEVVPVRPGDTVAPNQCVARVLLAEDLWVKAYVPEPQLGKVHLHQEVLVSSDAFPGKRCKGVITHIAAVSEFTPRNVQSAEERCNQVFAIKIRLLDAAELFKSGMAAEVIVPLSQQ